MTEVLTHSVTGEMPPSDRKTLDFMASGGEISLGEIPDTEQERNKPISYLDYGAAVMTIMDSIRREDGNDNAVSARFDSEFTEFMYVASLSYDVVLAMDEADATKAIKGWHPWQHDLYQLLRDGRRVLSVRATLKQPAEECAPVTMPAEIIA